MSLRLNFLVQSVLFLLLLACGQDTGTAPLDLPDGGGGDEEVSNLSSVLFVSAGGAHTCGVMTSGAAFCWGAGASGRLGSGSTDDESSPVAVAGGMTFSSISAGDFHTCGVTTSGAAFCWGF